MGHDNRSNRHFAEKKPHTRIKHSIFTDTLKTSLSIANNLAIKDSRKQAAIYTYVDLFAGRGMFEDETEGSPLLALNMFETHLTHEPSKNNFSTIQLITIEKSEDDLTALSSELNERLENSECRNRLKVYCGCGSWEDYVSQIKGVLSDSKWGFIYADPFSTELDIEQLIQLIDSCKHFKDVLIFINFNTLVRQTKRGHINDINRVSKSLGIKPEQLLANEDFSDLFKGALQDRFSELKQIIIGVAIPVTVEKKLITADYFYLLFATDSIKVADGFLKAYEKQVNEYRDKYMQPSFLGEYLADEIVQFLKEKLSNDVSLFEIISYLFNKFLSWKSAITDVNYKVPTIRNIISCLNDLRNNNNIIVSCGEDFFYKRNTAHWNKGDLAYSKLRRGKDTRLIKIGLKR